MASSFRDIALACAASVVAGTLTIGAPLATQTEDAATAALVERAGKYVESYVEAFSAVVCEERQTQKEIRADGKVKKVREIRSDFLLVKIGSPWPAAFRDVIEVDGKPVRNREDRLRKLFLEKPNRQAAEMARAIAEESRRYNLGLTRNGNSPLLPIIFLTSRITPRVKFTMTAPGSVAFEETSIPTVLASVVNGKRHELPSRGSFEIDPGTGEVRAADFSAQGEGSLYSAAFRVRYAIDPALKMSVPIEVKERYERLGKPSEDRIEVVATYSAFRRFQVSTAEQIK